LVTRSIIAFYLKNKNLSSSQFSRESRQVNSIVHQNNFIEQREILDVNSVLHHYHMLTEINRFI